MTAIHTTNHVWKLSQKWGDSFHALANSLVDRKARLQTELLRHHHDRVYLQRDPTSEAEAGEPIFGVLLDPPEPYRDAAHLPVRVACSYLSAAELERFTRDAPIEPVKSAESNGEVVRRQTDSTSHRKPPFRPHQPIVRLLVPRFEVVYTNLGRIAF